MKQAFLTLGMQLDGVDWVIGVPEGLLKRFRPACNRRTIWHDRHMTGASYVITGAVWTTAAV